MLDDKFGIIFDVANKRSIAWASAQAVAETGGGEELTTFEVIAFAVGVASLFVSFLALWVCFHFKSEADRVADETRRLLSEIRSESEAITRFGIGELERYGAAARSLMKRKNPRGRNG